MKKALYFIIVVSTIFVSCLKEGNDLPINDPTGNYFYESNSVYYNSLQKVDFIGNAEGGISILDDDEDLKIIVTPFFGYQYRISVNNLRSFGDTTVFSIPTQQLYLIDSYYSLFGTNNVDIPNIGNYDGYITSNSLVLKYRSNNIDSFQYVLTELKAKKKN